MSEENVELVRKAYEAFNRGDVEGAVANIAPDFVYVSTGVIPGMEGVKRGPAGLRRFSSNSAQNPSRKTPSWRSTRSSRPTIWCWPR